MSRSSDARAEDVELDATHLDLLRRYRDAVRHLLSLSRAEYAPRRENVCPEKEENGSLDEPNPNEDEDEDEDACVRRGPPLTISSVTYARLVVATTRRAFSWAVPTREALETVERHAGDHLVEMGAGTGFWTALLRARGNVRRIDAVDLAPCDGSEHNGHHAVRVALKNASGKKTKTANPPPFARVALGTPEDVLGRGTAPSALFLCWPPREKYEKEDHVFEKAPEEVSGMAIRALERFDGDAVLYVGEAPEFETFHGGEAIISAREPRGATAGPAFHAALHKEWRHVESVPLPNWPGASDSLTVWRRRSAESGLKTQKASKKTDGPDEVAATATATDVSKFETTRRALLLEAREAWESATVAGIAARASRGGARAMRGAEQTALRAVRERSGAFRRLALAFL